MASVVQKYMKALRVYGWRETLYKMYSVRDYLPGLRLISSWMYVRSHFSISHQRQHQLNKKNRASVERSCAFFKVRS